MGGRGAGLGEPTAASIKAIDPETGETKWEYKISRGSLAAGVLATAGDVVFAATGEGNADRSRRADRRGAVALSDRREHGGVADELCGGRQAIHRDLRGRSAV